jgi:hypothetical protein
MKNSHRNCTHKDVDSCPKCIGFDGDDCIFEDSSVLTASYFSKKVAL